MAWSTRLAKVDTSSFCGGEHVSSIHTQACCLRANSWCHIWEGCLYCGFFSLMSILWDTHPTSILSREKGSFIHSPMVCQAAALCIHPLQATGARPAQAPEQRSKNLSVQTHQWGWGAWERGITSIQVCCVRTGAGRAQRGIYISHVPLSLMQETQ